MSILLQIMLVAIVTSLACSSLGVFLVLKGNTMVADAITHTVLFGIVLTYFIVQDLNSPLLIFGAAFIGLITVWSIEAVENTKLINQDAAIGIIYPLFFSIAIVLITRYASSVHLDVDSVFTGELGFTIFQRYNIGDKDIGPKAFWNGLIVFFINLAYISIFYKELQVTIFDPQYAKSIGIPTLFIHYSLMALVSLTSVVAYDSVGSILVVGLIVGPALTGFLLSDDLHQVIRIAMISGIINAVLGVYLAHRFDVSYAGFIATITGITTLISYLFSPKRIRSNKHTLNSGPIIN